VVGRCVTAGLLGHEPIDGGDVAWSRGVSVGFVDFWLVSIREDYIFEC